MDNEIESLFVKKKKENMNIENSLFSSFEDCPFRSNTFQSNFNTTIGRISNKIEFSKSNNHNTNRGIKKNSKNDNDKRLNAIKKCFQIVKNRKEINKTIMGKCQKMLSEDKYANRGYITSNKESFSSTGNSFFNKRVDNFINNYLKSNICINENINTLNNNYENYNNNNYNTKNITVNKNSSLFNLTKNNNENKNIEKEKISIDINKNNKTSKIINRNTGTLKNNKKDKKKYINVNRMEALKMKHNNYISKIKNMFNNKKEEPLKNNSFCQRHLLSNSISNTNKITLLIKDYSKINN